MLFYPPSTSFLGSVFYVGCAVISVYPMLESTGINDMFTATHLTRFRNAVDLKDLGSVNKYCYDTPTKTLTKVREKDDLVVWTVLWDRNLNHTQGAWKAILKAQR